MKSDHKKSDHKNGPKVMSCVSADTSNIFEHIDTDTHSHGLCNIAVFIV